MKIKRDNIHYSTRRADSYEKPFNFCQSVRASGKTTTLITKIYKEFVHHHRPSIILRRQIIDITDVYIESIQESINTFLEPDKHVKFDFKKGSIKDGVVIVKIENKPFLMIVAMSNPLSRIKSLICPSENNDGPAYILFDEYIVDTKTEKDVPDLANKFQSLFDTFNRQATQAGHRLICWFIGNTYTIYSQLHIWLGMDLEKLVPGAFIVGKNYTYEFYQLTPELQAWILKTNPLYEIESQYTLSMGFGQTINDNRYEIVNKQPPSYNLRYIFYINNKYLAVYHRSMNRDKPGHDYGKYWVATMKNYDGSKNVFAIDFDSLVRGTKLITADIRVVMIRLKEAIGNRDIAYETVECGYLMEEIYKAI